MHENGKATFMQDDAYVQQAIPKLLTLFQDEYRRPLRKPYYLRQLQVLLENDYFPWVISNALVQLVDQGILHKVRYVSKAHRKLVFFFNGKLSTPDHERAMMTHIKSIGALIDTYANPTTSRILGKHLEALVKQELRAQGFEVVETEANSYKGRRWTKTNHDLDFIAEHESGNLNIGIEVKNTLSVIEREELDVKLEMCKYLRLRPVFAARWIKPYLNHIAKDYDGFSWVFKTQIFPLGQEDLVKGIYNRLNLPVTVRTDLPPKPVSIFKKWVQRNT